MARLSALNHQGFFGGDTGDRDKHLVTVSMTGIFEACQKKSAEIPPLRAPQSALA